MDYMRPLFKNHFGFNWKSGLFLILIFGIPRFITVLHANKTGDYGFTSIIFVVMWLLPFLLLNKSGRRDIGLTKPIHLTSLLWGFVLGGLVCLGVWLIGKWLYADTLENWIVYISRSYQVPADSNFETVKFYYFIIFALTSMIFSPIGEEFLYRGVIHRCFLEKFGDDKASIIDSAAFGVTHLAHFGILYVDNHWELAVIPGLLWVFLMFTASRVFFQMKKNANSLWGAVCSHAGFNLAMTYIIFYHVF